MNSRRLVILLASSASSASLDIPSGIPGYASVCCISADKSRKEFCEKEIKRYKFTISAETVNIAGIVVTKNIIPTKSLDAVLFVKYNTTVIAARQR